VEGHWLFDCPKCGELTLFEEPEDAVCDCGWSLEKVVQDACRERGKDFEQLMRICRFDLWLAMARLDEEPQS
jgi:hypothetical protein